MKAFKFTTDSNDAPFVSEFRYVPGLRYVLPSDRELNPCVSGFHAVTAENVMEWMNQKLWEVELGGTIIHADLKLVASEITLIKPVKKWNAAEQWKFYADELELLLPIWRAIRGDDRLAKMAIEVYRNNLDGWEAVTAELGTRSASTLPVAEHTCSLQCWKHGQAACSLVGDLQSAFFGPINLLKSAARGSGWCPRGYTFFNRISWAVDSFLDAVSNVQNRDALGLINAVEGELHHARFNKHFLGE